MSQDQEANRKHVVVLVHGIRDFARWHANVKPALEEAGFVVQPTNYGRMNLIEFLLPLNFFRKIAAEKVLTQVRFAKQLYPGAQISVIAHSFGTYVVSRLLQSEFDLRLHRVVFCGSVVRYDFPFEQLNQRFTHPILNDVGTADPWPAIAEAVTTGYGSAGTFGFNRAGVVDRYHNDACHGYFLNPGFATEFWVNFLHSGEIVPACQDAKGQKAKSPPVWVQLVSIFKVKYIFAAFFVFIALLKLVQVMSGPSGASTFTFAGPTYVYWNDPASKLLRAVREPCSLRPSLLCESDLIVRVVAKRRFIAIQEEDPRIRQIVSCGAFEITETDPNMALHKLYGRYPSCFEAEIGSTGWILRLKLEGVVEVPQSSDKPLYLCGCSADQTQRFAHPL